MHRRGAGRRGGACRRGGAGGTGGENTMLKQFLELTAAQIGERKNSLKKSGAVKTLQEIVLSSIIRKNLSFHTKNKSDTTYLGNLPGPLRNEVLKGLTNHQFRYDEAEFQMRLEAFKLLLNSRTYNIDLYGLMETCPDMIIKNSYTKVLNYIATYAPNINDLRIRQSEYSRLSLCDEALCSLKKMKHLRKLQLEVHTLEIVDMLELCLCLPDLVFLKVKLVNTKSIAALSHTKFSRSLPNLRVFTFMEVKLEESYSLEKLKKTAEDTLPKLEIVEEFFSYSKFLMWDAPNFDCQSSPMELFPGTSNLKKLSLTRGNPFKTSAFLHQKYPRVAELEIDWKYAAHILCKGETYLASFISQFPHVRHLTFVEHVPTPEKLITLLEACGSELESLMISNQFLDGFRHNLNKICELCPKLAKLSMNNVSLDCSANEDFVFKELRELEWTDRYSRRSTELIQILIAAPRLERVNLTGCEFHNCDLLEATSLLRDQKILTQLKEFQFN